MNDEALSSVAPQRPVALIDLVETKTAVANAAFVTKVTQLAEETGGRRVLANKAIAPMIVPDERASKPDHATGLLVVTQYPTPEAGRIALAKRDELGPGSAISLPNSRDFQRATSPGLRKPSFNYLSPNLVSIKK